jgi:hypothetical protein
MFSADPQLTTIPQWLINQGIKCIALVFLNMISRMARRLPERYKKLIAEKEGFYNQVSTRIARGRRELAEQNDQGKKDDLNEMLKEKEDVF